MVRSIYFFIFLFFSIGFYAQSDTTSVTKEDLTLLIQMDSLAKSITFKTGKVKIGTIGSLDIPSGYKYLDPDNANKVLVDLWGNQKSENTLGLLVKENFDPMGDSIIAYEISFDELGYVKDDDADKIDYADLLKTLQEGAVEESKATGRQIAIVGWAASPFYDKTKKVLHWAQEIKFGDSEVNTLNYNVRILGRKGVLIMNAISDMSQVSNVKAAVPTLFSAFQYNEGQKYEDFDGKIDNVAEWTIGGLVAGKIAAKLGFFGLLAKFGKFIVLGVVALGGMIMKFFRGSKEEEAPIASDNPIDENTENQENQNS
jgi:uncharacterized membrane-anchored protein